LLKPRGGHNRKVTPQQRAELLRLHLAKDQEGARSLALQLGLDRDYAAAHASQLGYKPTINPFPTQHRWVNP
jgi:hypothetical protein